jgi:hypothetical protein
MEDRMRAFIGCGLAAIVIWLMCSHLGWFLLAGGLIVGYYLLTQFNLVPKDENKDAEEKPLFQRNFMKDEERQEYEIRGMVKPNLKSDEHYQALARKVRKSIYEARKRESRRNVDNQVHSSLF